MKSRVYVGGLMCVLVIAFGGCKAKESAYKQVYETAQARPTVSQTPTVSTDNSSRIIEQPQPSSVNDYFAEEKVTVMGGGNLKQYCVVIGSFINKTNAESRKNLVQKDGYSPVIVQNEKGMYRVIVAAFDTRAEAVAKRDAIKRQYRDFYDAWLLAPQY